jgi:TatA/E family protein of Tat protein translocase
MPFNIQGPELILILIIALVVIGPGKLPDVGAALGRSIKEFRKAASDVTESTSLSTSPTPAAPAAPAAATAPPAAATSPVVATTPPVPATPTVTTESTTDSAAS